MIGIGPCLFFGKHLVQHTNRPIGLIGVASGGWMAQIWDPRQMAGGKMPGRPYLYGPMIQRIIQAGGYGKLKGMVWDQGASDALQKPSASKDYEQNLTTFISGVRRDTGNPDLPVIVVQLGRVSPPPCPAFPASVPWAKSTTTFMRPTPKAASASPRPRGGVAETLKNAYLVPSADLFPLEDPVHWGSGAYQRLGPRVAEVALSQVYKVPGHGTPIKLESIELVDRRDSRTGGEIPGHHQSTIRVRFSGVSGRLHAAGRPLGFSLRFPGMTPAQAQNGVPVIFAVEFDPKEPAAVQLHVSGYPSGLHKRGPVLCYGAGLDPSINIVDDKDMAIAAFGPVAIPAPKEEPTIAPSQPGQSAKAPVQVPEDLVFRRNVEYCPGGTGIQWRLDYFKPADAAGPLPAIVMVHGGGWKGAGGKTNYNPICIRWAQRGYFVMAIEYRTSSSTVSTFPEAIEDCKCAVRWLRSQASTLGVDASRIGVYGSSAGGHLAMMLGILSKEKFGDHYEGDGPWQDQSSDVSAVVSDAGVVNLDQSIPGNSGLDAPSMIFWAGLLPPGPRSTMLHQPAMPTGRPSFPPSSCSMARPTNRCRSP